MADWGFLGAGGIARSSLAPAVHAADGAVLGAVAARDPARARALGPRRVHPSYGGLLRDPAVEVVYVALHNSAHREWVERALLAGKHVLCEKPLALSADDAGSMAATARRTGRLLTEAAWNRWHPRTRDMEALLAAGAVGDVTGVTARFAGLAPGEGNYRLDRALGGGALYDVGYYAVSAALAAFGWRTPRVTRARRERWHPGSADSLTEFSLDFAGRGTADIHCSLVGTMEDTLTVSGTEGTLHLSPPAFCAGAEPSRLRVDGGGVDGGGVDRVYPAVDPYRLMVESVDAAVSGRRDPYLVPQGESLLVAATLDAVRAHLDDARPDGRTGRG